MSTVVNSTMTTFIANSESIAKRQVFKVLCSSDLKLDKMFPYIYGYFKNAAHNRRMALLFKAIICGSSWQFYFYNLCEP